MNPLKNASRLKSKLRSRDLVFGAWTSFGHPQITEIFAKVPFDFIGIDIEHSTISLEQTLNIIEVAQAKGCCCLPRIASHNPEAIKRILDSGADGLIVPMVNNPAETQNLVNWSKYSPIGNRSFGMARAQGYGFDFDEYVKNWNNSSSLVVQIESVEAVRNVEEIVRNENVDGAMIGPYDISGSLGIPGQIDHPKVREAGEVVLAACKKYGKSCGTQLTEPDEQGIQEKVQAGYNFIVLASDLFILWKWADKMKGLINKHV